MEDNFELSEFKFTSFNCPICSIKLTIYEGKIYKYEIVCDKCNCIFDVAETEDEIHLIYDDEQPTKRYKSDK